MMVRQQNNQNTQSQSNITTSVSQYTSEDSQNSQVQRENRNKIILKYDENIAKIVALGMEEKLIKNQLGKIDISDALVKVSSNVNIFSVKQSANFLFAISKLINYGYLSLNQELKDFFARFKDQIMKQQQQQQQKEKQHRSSRKNQTKKRLRDAAKEIADNLSNSIDERSNTSIQQPRHISTEERLNMQEQNLISPLAMMINQRSDLDSDNENSNTGFSDNLPDPNQQRLMMLGEDNLAGIEFDGGLGMDTGFDYDGFQYDFSEQDSQSQGFNKVNGNAINISQELNQVGDISERYIRKITNYANQQSSKKKKKTKQKQQGHNKEGEHAILNETVDMDNQEFSKAMDEKLNQFYSSQSQRVNKNISHISDISRLSTTLQQPSILSQNFNIYEESISEAPFQQINISNYLNASTLVDQPILNLTKKFDEAISLKENDNNVLLSEELISKLEKAMQNINIDLVKQDQGGVDMMDFNQDNQGGYMDYPDDFGSLDQYNQQKEEQDGELEIPVQIPEIQKSKLEKDKKIDEIDSLQDFDITPLDKKILTEEEQRVLQQYDKLFTKLRDILDKEPTAEFNDVYQSFKNQKSKAELFYDILELQKLGQISVSQNDNIHFSPIQILIK
ncbi:hypothetical protein TTHERM_00245660 (macronuclear) [Tetrahymena thermophila SB210]|uniref:Uncharacterized protein n=1 Tax=Tetrahymena thermophila (strain SB210) TaxID=312017 RepID=Q245T3_TETTS|nr:hypothetical protein TTHERM_00245660 [Tetrahymena thermophila SB210]EAS03550.2 hypothetical protein TTHERM_00245660 [Tetrahymena thermophila SB210]|eukprot:XP_001023795.2 hypothetical protein TTHERM_00245660 [Tetrahymena thermophila SB210]